VKKAEALCGSLKEEGLFNGKDEISIRRPPPAAAIQYPLTTQYWWIASTFLDIFSTTSASSSLNVRKVANFY
jgi:hypothetical protein